jgi:hypothetical protein
MVNGLVRRGAVHLVAAAVAAVLVRPPFGPMKQPVIRPPHGEQITPQPRTGSTVCNE